MATSSVTAVYIHVVEDVISKVRDEFIKLGAGENVLNELQGLWEMKMIQCGAINGPIERSAAPKGSAGPITPVHDLNVPYEGTEEYETPTAEMLFPPTPLQTPIQTPLPGGIEQSLYHLPTPSGTGEYGGTHDNRVTADIKPGRPSPYMPPPSPWMNQRPLGVDVNVAYVEGRDEVDRGAPHQPATQDFFTMSSGKRKRDDYASQIQQGGYIPQQDGPGDSTSEYFKLEANPVQSSGRDIKLTQNGDLRSNVHNGYDDLFRFPGTPHEVYSASADHDGRVSQNVATPNPVQNHATEDEEPSLNEDDDDDDDLDDIDQGDEEPDTHHLILAQFDKVSRTKSRWKCMLKDGIMHINNKDILFTKATGEFEF